jgi:serine/threonine-protein kinase
MGEVFLAEDLALGRKVALEFLHADARGDVRARERFVREARAAAALDDPFICKVYEAGQADDRDYIAMEFVDGRTLKNRIAEGPLPPEELR